MAEAFAMGDAGFIAHALGIVARAKKVRLRGRACCGGWTHLVRFSTAQRLATARMFTNESVGFIRVWGALIHRQTRLFSFRKTILESSRGKTCRPKPDDRLIGEYAIGAARRRQLHVVRQIGWILSNSASRMLSALGT